MSRCYLCGARVVNGFGVPAGGLGWVRNARAMGRGMVGVIRGLGWVRFGSSVR